MGLHRVYEGCFFVLPGFVGLSRSFNGYSKRGGLPRVPEGLLGLALRVQTQTTPS